jgi:hypothetical protein
MMHWTERSGTCGEVEPELVSLDPSAVVEIDDNGEGCELHSETLSEGGCKLERSLTCYTRVADRTMWGGYDLIKTRMVAVTRQVTQDGSRLDGAATVAHETSSASCRSTYDLLAIRQ